MSGPVPDPTSPFVGSSETASLMRRFDWWSSPLGSPDQWPQSLQTVVRVLLTSRYAMWMGWGPDLTFLYNDAYAKMTLGAKHPWALGRPAHEVWIEIWNQIGPRIDRVLGTGDATWDEALQLFLQRSGYPEETYHTFSYSPLADDDGRIRGLLCVVTEETERVIGERRLGLLRDVAAEIATSKTEQDLWGALTRSLATHPRDLPFTLTYLFDSQASSAYLACRTGIDAESPYAPANIEDGDHRVWPVSMARDNGTPHLTEVPSGAEAVPRGPWDISPTHALIIPIAQQGQSRPAGVFVAALNPYRVLDESYRSFLGLLVGQIAAGIANVRTYQEERRRGEALAEIDRAKTTFFSNISHELRTPLTLLLGPLEDALGLPDPALRGPDLETSYRNALRLLKLVNALLDFARIEAGRVHARFAPTDLATLTRDLASTFRSAFERAGLSFSVTCEAMPALFVDRDMWEKIVLNLLSNALKFTFEGGVALSLRATGEGAILTVSDTGIGVAPDELPRLFERFHRIEGVRARTHEGSGIGLALVQELVRMHGGSIHADSTPGAGTRITIALKSGTAHLPQDRVALRDEGSRSLAGRAFVEESMHWLPETAEPEPRRARTGRLPRILLADDNADMRGYVTRLLEPSWSVEAVANGGEALAALRHEPADLLLTDVMMPVLDGLELLKAMKADPVLRSVPVIMLSARSGEEAKVQGLDAGADDYIFKPFSARELLARVRNQLELASARQQAASERDRLRSLLAHVPARVNFFSGPELIFEFAHPLAVTSAGGRPLQGRPLLDALPEQRDQPFYEMLRRVYETGEPVSGEEVLVRIEGTNTGVLEDSFWSFRYLPITNASGEVDGVMTFELDVTEQVLARKRLEDQALELQAAREGAEVANRTKDEFLAILGHELRNPLAPIMTALQLMELRGLRSREQEVIARQVGHLTRLVDDLLDVSRITRGRVDLQLETQEIDTVVARAMELASPLLEQRRLHVTLDVPARGLIVSGDPARLAQVVTNLLTNAAKYSDPETTVLVRARADGDTIELSVRDHGVGIAPEMLERVFDLFVQQPQTLDRSEGGLGLGLTIARTLVEKHGGTLRARSDGPGHGSEFIVRLPAARVQRLPVDAGRGPARPGPALVRDTVLVVDDNHDAAEMLQVALESLGYQVLVAHDGPSALKACADHAPQIALLDIGLPVMDGYELARRIRQQVPGRGRIRLIAVTGYGQQTDRDRSMASGFESHLVKPLDLARLRLVLEGRESDLH